MKTMPSLARMVRKQRRTMERQWRQKTPISAAETLQAVKEVFQAAQKLPPYRKMLSSRRHRLNQATPLAEAGKLLPIFDKTMLFGNRRLDQILTPERIRQVGLIYTSSGFTGRFAWGMDPRPLMFDLNKSAGKKPGELDVLLDWLFDIADTPTLLINALPTGVRIDAGLVTLIETGPRPDSVTAAMRTLRPCFHQTILVGDWPLLKEALEAAIQARALTAPGGKLHLITGGDWIAENWRHYVMGLLAGVSPKLPGKCVINFGVSELGLSVGLETESCRRVRQAAHRDGELREKLFGPWPVVPTLVQYPPNRYWIETPVIDGFPRLVVTTLDKERLFPLIRYTTGDWAQVWSYQQWCHRLDHAGHPDLKPKERLPVLAVWGRGPQSRSKPDPLSSSDGATLSAQIREALFARPALAANATGHFIFEPSRRLHRITIQLKPGRKNQPVVIRELEKSLSQAWKQAVRVRTLAYHRYHPGMEPNYLRKFRHELSENMSNFAKKA